MFRRFIKWLKSFFRNLFRMQHGKNYRYKDNLKPRAKLTDTEYESLFIQLLNGVNDGWSLPQVRDFLDRSNIIQADLLVWLQGFSDKLLATDVENDELALRMLKLGKVDIGKLGELASSIGIQLKQRKKQIVSHHANTFVNVESEDAEIWFQKGLDKNRVGDLETAVICWQKAVKIEPEYQSAWYQLAYALSDLGKQEEAILAYDEALAIQPEDYQAWYNKGNALIDLLRFDEAVTCFQKTVEIQPDFYHAWNNLGSTLGCLEKLEEAFTAYNQAIELQPNDYQAWKNRGLALEKLGRLEEAFASYDKAVEIKPDYQDASKYKDLALRNLEKRKQATMSSNKLTIIQRE
ncbi:tetratricopeptide repeat protein [Calothrix sp. UHCC 0171]|uniref:tetratricopeptide repeat protein n=1 Tax=Calothrix sp. UHCC 0171 TaxID=3110245 RepID=UPI002B1F44E2|nr:tetratricopeptide repeat protein [Calothrix sp. UHCC 0171]MEA5574241.1 tetratricopeptide repeat protein [Calothrix sp. UHCC 0171]